MLPANCLTKTMWIIYKDINYIFIKPCIIMTKISEKIEWVDDEQHGNDKGKNT